MNPHKKIVKMDIFEESLQEFFETSGEILIKPPEPLTDKQKNFLKAVSERFTDHCHSTFSHKTDHERKVMVQKTKARIANKKCKQK